MALDGIVIANMVYEMNQRILNGRIAKISQPEMDELMITVKNQKEQHRLLISSGASLPLIYFTEKNKSGPMSAPNFCMLLRKHIGSGRIVSISQPGLERVIQISVEHRNELGDLCKKNLYVELMGKHSNIIFCNEEDQIIDSIKHIPAHISSVREVLPGRSYFIPDTIGKENPLAITEEKFCSVISQKNMPLIKALYTSLTGLSPICAEEICHLASLDSDRPAAELKDLEQIHLYHTLNQIMDDIKNKRFYPNIIKKAGEPIEFASIKLTCLSSYEEIAYESISRVLEDYYAMKNIITRIRQKSQDLRKVVQTSLERNLKKLDLMQKQLKDTDKRDTYQIYGELLNTYGYQLSGGESSFPVMNYHTGKEITIPLDNKLSAKDNAKKFFDRYNKLKRTALAVADQLKETEQEIEHLQSISTSLDIALLEEDLAEIKEELREFGYIKKRALKDKKSKIISKPYHYISSDGFHVYVGKNNYQNEQITFKLASSQDWWFHAKEMPGSHVIVKSDGRQLPDKTFEEAARLAAFYSKGRDSKKVEIDYVKRMQLKKVNGGAPGFVIYHTNYSMMAEPNIMGIKEVNE